MDRCSDRDFNPRSPCGLRHNSPYMPIRCRIFQSTQPMRAATVSAGNKRLRSLFQSTQPMRAATTGYSVENISSFISIHAAHAGCDRSRNFPLPAVQYFNPRSPCGLRLDSYLSLSRCREVFQSTQPMRAATTEPEFIRFASYISIHAAHAGCDISNLEKH